MPEKPTHQPVQFVSVHGDNLFAIPQEEVQQEGKKEGRLEKLRTIGTSLMEYRDLIIVLSGASYITGYIIWSVYAFSHHLGLLSALDTQYFIAGIPAVVFILCSFALGRLIFHWLFVTWPLWLEKPKRLTSLAKVLYPIFRHSQWILYGSFLLYWWLSYVPSLIKLGGSILSLVLMVFTILGGVVAKDRIMRSLGILYYILMISLFPIVILFMYVLAIFPFLPQEFGGVAPRCAQLDIATDYLTSDTVTALIGSKPTNAQPIVRTLPLNIVYKRADSTTIIVNQQIYEITNDAIRAIIVCP